MLVRGGTSKPLPPAIVGTECKKWLKLLGITFQDDPRCWDLHVDNLLSKAGSRIYILRVCSYYGYSRDYLSKLFDSLIISLFLYEIEVGGSALQNRHLECIDKFFKRAHRYGYTLKKFKVSELIEERDIILCNKIVNDSEHVLQELLPEKKRRILRDREHPFILPKVTTERFKRSFLNRCLFNYF